MFRQVKTWSDKFKHIQTISNIIRLVEMDSNMFKYVKTNSNVLQTDPNRFKHLSHRKTIGSCLKAFGDHNIKNFCF